MKDLPSESGWITVDWQAKDNRENEKVKKSLLMISDNAEEKALRDERNENILSFLEEGFEIHEPLGPRIITGKMLFQVLWRMLSQMKLHDFVLRGTGAEQWQEEVMTMMFNTILDRGGLDDVFRDKGGLAQNLITTGDAFCLIQAREKDGFPVQFSALENSNVFVNLKANGMRSCTRPVRQCTVIFSGTFDEFLSNYPDAKERGCGLGKIPRTRENYGETSNTLTEVGRPQRNEVEWAYSWDLDREEYVMYVGSACTVYEERSGKEYVWKYKDSYGLEEAYIPVPHFKCYPSTKGFYNNSPCAYAYDISRFYAMLMNEMGLSVKHNVFNVKIVNIPQGKIPDFYRRMEAVHQQNAMGLQSFLPMEYSATNPSGVSVQSANVPSPIAEAQAMFEMLIRMMNQIGIYLEAPEIQGETATKTNTNVEMAYQSAKQIMKGNSSEFQFILDIVLDLSRKTIKDGDDSYLNITGTVNYNNNAVNPGNLYRLGDFKEQLMERHYFTELDPESGVIKPNVIRKAEIMEILAITPPGTPEYADLYGRLRAMNNLKLSPEQSTNLLQNPGLTGNINGQVGAGNVKIPSV